MSINIRRCRLCRAIQQLMENAVCRGAITHWLTGLQRKTKQRNRKKKKAKILSIICWVYKQRDNRLKDRQCPIQSICLYFCWLSVFQVTHNSHTHSKRCFLPGWTQPLSVSIQHRTRVQLNLTICSLLLLNKSKSMDSPAHPRYSHTVTYLLKIFISFHLVYGFKS